MAELYQSEVDRAWSEPGDEAAPAAVPPRHGALPPPPAVLPEATNTFAPIARGRARRPRHRDRDDATLIVRPFAGARAGARRSRWGLAALVGLCAAVALALVVTRAPGPATPAQRRAANTATTAQHAKSVREAKLAANKAAGTKRANATARKAKHPKLAMKTTTKAKSTKRATKTKSTERATRAKTAKRATNATSAERAKKAKVTKRATNATSAEPAAKAKIAKRATNATSTKRPSTAKRPAEAKRESKANRR